MTMDCLFSWRRPRRSYAQPGWILLRWPSSVAVKSTSTRRARSLTSIKTKVLSISTDSRTTHSLTFFMTHGAWLHVPITKCKIQKSCHWRQWHMASLLTNIISLAAAAILLCIWWLYYILVKLAVELKLTILCLYKCRKRQHNTSDTTLCCCRSIQHAIQYLPEASWFVTADGPAPCWTLWAYVQQQPIAAPESSCQHWGPGSLQEGTDRCFCLGDYSKGFQLRFIQTSLAHMRQGEK